MSDTPIVSDFPSEKQPTKRCKKCGRELPATREYFSPNPSMRDGLISTCKQCKRKSTPEQYAAWKAKREQSLKHYQSKNGVYISGFEEIPGYFKIGVTGELPIRFGALRTNIPFDPILIYFKECLTWNGAVYLEEYLHKIFADKHHKREWFKLTAEDIQWIKDLVYLETEEQKREYEAKRNQNGGPDDR